MCVRMMVALFDRVQYNAVLYMGSCMGVILAGKPYCGTCRTGDPEVSLFDFIKGTSLAYQSCQPPQKCTVEEVTVDAITITSGCATSLHIWHGICNILAFSTQARARWNAYTEMREGPSEDPRRTLGDSWRTPGGPSDDFSRTLGGPSGTSRRSRRRTSSKSEEVGSEPPQNFRKSRANLF